MFARCQHFHASITIPHLSNSWRVHIKGSGDWPLLVCDISARTLLHENSLKVLLSTFQVILSIVRVAKSITLPRFKLVVTMQDNRRKSLCVVVYLLLSCSPCHSFLSTLPSGASGVQGLRRSPLVVDFRHDRTLRTSTPSSQSRRAKMQPLLITKTFFERMETRSGKDYSWIRPLTQPVSELMK